MIPRPTLPLLPLALLALSTPVFAAADPETLRLRAQVEQLQAQIRAMQAQCPTAVAPTVSTLEPPAAPAAAVAAPVAPAVASGAAAQAPAAPAAPQAPAAPTPPAGYKLVKIDPNAAPDLPKDGRFRDPNSWEALSRGMSETEVESLLGLEHRTLTKNGRTQWSYGVPGVSPVGRVIFVDGRVSIWEQPNF